MRIPKTLKVGGHKYKVLFPYHFTERADLYGDHDPTTKQIRIDDTDIYTHDPRPDSGICTTFLHEILHACNFNCGHMIFDKDKVEEQISALAEALYQILHDNKLQF